MYRFSGGVGGRLLASGMNALLSELLTKRASTSMYERQSSLLSLGCALGVVAFLIYTWTSTVDGSIVRYFGKPEQDAIAYLLAHTALTEADAIAEVERYIALPAQALSYKLGQRVFLDLRARAENALQDRFDLRRFHDALLAEGAMPLPLLEARMTRWMASEQAH